MRFNQSDKHLKTASTIGPYIIFTFTLLTISLHIQNKLILYIHPRYVLFTVIFASVGFLFSLYVIFTSDGLKIHKKQLWLVVFTVFALLLTPSSLSVDIAQNRGTTSQTSDFVATVYDSYTDNYDQLSLADWSSLFEGPGATEFYVDKSIVTSGFLTPTENNDTDVVYISRFVIACCAVDARLIAVPAHIPDWNNLYKPGDWVSITGRTTVKDNRLIIQPKNIEPIDIPEVPYVY